MVADIINSVSEILWEFFLPLLIFLGLFINVKMWYRRKKWMQCEQSAWQFHRIRGALSISLASKVGTGAIIGVLAAMWQSSLYGGNGIGIVFWVLIGALFLVPITYSEVLFTQVCKQTPRDFIHTHMNAKVAFVYAIGLISLYAFGFVGFQLMGVQTVVRYIAEQYFDYQFNSVNALLYIVFPIIIVIATVIVTKNHHLFINTLSSLIFFIILIYLIFFLFFVYQTQTFIKQYFMQIYLDVMNAHNVGIGLPIGLVIACQRIIQISETSLGTSSLSSSDRKESPHREALVQTVATLISIAIAVVITSYIFLYGQIYIKDVSLVADGFLRIKGYLVTVYDVTGYLGLAVVVLFFIISGFTTILGSFHYVNTSLKTDENKRIIIYLCLISVSGFLSVTHFDIIFEASNLLMFVVGIINLSAMAIFIKNQKSKIKNHKSKLK